MQNDEIPEMAEISQARGPHQTGELCSSCEPFIFRVLGVFRGLTRRFGATG